MILKPLIPLALCVLLSGCSTPPPVQHQVKQPTCLQIATRNARQLALLMTQPQVVALLGEPSTTSAPVSAGTMIGLLAETNAHVFSVPVLAWDYIYPNGYGAATDLHLNFALDLRDTNNVRWKLSGWNWTFPP